MQQCSDRVERSRCPRGAPQGSAGGATGQDHVFRGLSRRRHVTAPGHAVQQWDAGRVVQAQAQHIARAEAVELAVVDQHRDVMGRADGADLFRGRAGVEVHEIGAGARDRDDRLGVRPGVPAQDPDRGAGLRAAVQQGVGEHRGAVLGLGEGDLLGLRVVDVDDGHGLGVTYRSQRESQRRRRTPFAEGPEHAGRDHGVARAGQSGPQGAERSGLRDVRGVGHAAQRVQGTHATILAQRVPGAATASMRVCV